MPFKHWRIDRLNPFKIGRGLDHCPPGSQRNFEILAEVRPVPDAPHIVDLIVSAPRLRSAAVAVIDACNYGDEAEQDRAFTELWEAAVKAGGIVKGSTADEERKKNSDTSNIRDDT